MRISVAFAGHAGTKPFMRLKSLIKSVFRAAQFDIVQITPEKELSQDSAYAQRTLLRARDVRTIFDIGANTGQTARQYAADFPAATIYSFEPFDEAFAQLAQLAVRLPNVKAQKIAISDVSGVRPLFVNEGNMTNSLLPIAPGAAERIGDGAMRAMRKVEAPTDTIDAFCQARSIDRIDILKMDIQGGELMALKGASGMLGKHAVSLVYCEILFAGLYTGQASFCDVLGEMQSRGYSLFGIYNCKRPAGKCVAWGDAIFLGPDLVSDGRLT
ncbi:MAG TPA: FkbM family methyltransferase [Humisphaera sp.]|nr:FkbM family methyltransferase [Humisphaera sp.]